MNLNRVPGPSLSIRNNACREDRSSRLWIAPSNMRLEDRAGFLLAAVHHDRTAVVRAVSIQYWWEPTGAHGLNPCLATVKIRLALVDRAQGVGSSIFVGVARVKERSNRDEVWHLLETGAAPERIELAAALAVEWSDGICTQTESARRAILY
jgi:hypothetical protein